VRGSFARTVGKRLAAPSDTKLVHMPPDASKLKIDAFELKRSWATLL
jgi:hypothetical protein